MTRTGFGGRPLGVARHSGRRDGADGARALEAKSRRGYIAMMHDPILIIGGGQAAGQIVLSLRKAGVETPIVLISEEAHPPYRRPPLSKAYLAGEMSLEGLFLQPAEAYAALDGELLTGRRAVAIDRNAKRVTLDDGRALAYSKLVFAAGARVRKPPVPGAALSGVHYLRDVADVEAIRAALPEISRAVVVGGGFIGLEGASVLRKLGKSVTVLEMAERLMARAVSPPLSEHFAALHRAHGVDLRLAEGIAAIEGGARVEAVLTTGGARLPADLVLMGVGVIPNVELAQAAGLDVMNGIKVDAFCRTGDPDVYAVGDCANFDHPIYGPGLRLESVQNAVDQAKTAALAIAGRPARYEAVPWFWSDQYDVKLQMAGLGADADLIVRRGDPAAGSFSLFGFREGVLRVVESVDAPADHMIARRLLAAPRPPLTPEEAGDPAFDLKSAMMRAAA